MVKHAAAMRLPAAMVSQRPIGGRDGDSVTIIDAGTTNSTNTGASITRLVSVAPAPIIARARARRLIRTGGRLEGLVGQPEAVPGLVVLQRGALLVAQEIQVSGDGAPRDAELAHEVPAVRQVAGFRALAHHLDHAPDAVVLRAGAGLHFSRIFFGAVPLDGVLCGHSLTLSSPKGQGYPLQTCRPSLVLRDTVLTSG